jgi:hypothetical protein
MNFKPAEKIIANLAALVFALGAYASPPAAVAQAVAQSQADSATEETGKTEKQPGQSRNWGNFLPLPIIVTEPAIGEGLGATLIYFHHEEERENQRVSTAQEIGRTGERSKPPPTASAIFGFYTNNDTYAAGIGHSNTFADDHYRLRAALANARVNSKVYLGDRPIKFQLEGNLLFANLKKRLGDSSVFLGVSTSYLDASNRFVGGSGTIGNLLDFDLVNSGIAASLNYDTRDNTILPAKGFHVELIGWRFDEALGGDFDYTTVRLKALGFAPLGEKFVLGARVDSGHVDGQPPFFDYPYVRLRGIPALRYQGKVASAFELELRRRMADRWTASLFGGFGTVRIGDELVDTEDNIRTIGVGTRYLAYREQDAWVGVDIARGPEEVAFYIQMGSSW